MVTQNWTSKKHGTAEEIMKIRNKKSLSKIEENVKYLPLAKGVPF